MYTLKFLPYATFGGMESRSVWLFSRKYFVENHWWCEQFSTKQFVESAKGRFNYAPLTILPKGPDAGFG